MQGASGADEQSAEYYEFNLDGERIELEGASIFSALEGVFQKHLKPRKTHAALRWGNSPFILSPTGLLVRVSNTAHPPQLTGMVFGAGG